MGCDRPGWKEGHPSPASKRPAARSASYPPPPPILVISHGTVKRAEVRSGASSLKAPEGSGPYKGANISVEAKGLELETLLKKIAGSAGKTISVPDYELFNHQVTLKLEQRPWDETLEAILSLRGLGYEESGPTLTVCAASNFYAAQGLKECTRKPDSLNGNSSGGNEPLLANSFTVRHVPVDQAGAEMFRLKSGRGRVRIIGDDIFIKDTPEAVTAMTRLVNNLDNDYRPDSKTQAAQ